LTLPNAQRPAGVQVFDMNADGKLDIITADGSVANAYVYLGMGMFKFGMPTAFPISAIAQWAQSGDFDNDGQLDFATLNTASDRSVSILINKGGGAFKPMINHDVGPGSFALAVGDINSDK